MINIFEMGFGIGLSALLALIDAEKHQQKIYYGAIELSPLEEPLICSLDYCEQLQRKGLQKTFEQLRSSEWGKEMIIAPYFSFKKMKISLLDHTPPDLINLIYYGAFGPNAQPGLWQGEVLKKLSNALSGDGILVAYCPKGKIKRAMQGARFTVGKMQGPPGKREMIRAIRTDNKATKPGLPYGPPHSLR